MKNPNLIALVKWVHRLTIFVFSLVILLFISTIYYVADPSLSFFSKRQKKETHAQVPTVISDEIKDGIHVATGLKEGEGLLLVVQNCTACHSAKMITQNRATKEGWRSMIKWMQETQNLWELGQNEEIIVSYLATNYPPGKSSRRAPLTNIEWYELEQ